jgi:hypothetical protein
MKTISYCILRELKVFNQIILLLPLFGILIFFVLVSTLKLINDEYLESLCLYLPCILGAWVIFYDKLSDEDEWLKILPVNKITVFFGKYLAGLIFALVFGISLNLILYYYLKQMTLPKSIISYPVFVLFNYTINFFAVCLFNLIRYR